MRRAVVLALCCGAVLPATAQAGVRIGGERIVVTARGASATVERSPFRISFADAAGRRVLAQVPNRRPGPFPTPPLPDPEPIGADLADRPTLYAPLAFTVGVDGSLQHPSGQWAGAQLVGTETGVQYAARDVLRAERHADGVRLVVSTSDPSGRRLVVTVAPARPGAIRVTARPSPDDGVASMADAFASGGREAFRGFGGRHNELDQHGQDFVNWVEQQNVGAGPLQPVADAIPGGDGDRYLFPNGPTAAFYPQAQFVSSRGYGFLLERDELSRWRMASDRGDAWHVSTAARGLDYVVAPGAAPRAIRTLTGMTGRQRVPPDWATGPMFDRLVRTFVETAPEYKAKVEDDLREIERRGLPVSAYRIEGWPLYSEAELRRLIDRLHARGIRALLYFRPFVDTSAGPGTDDPAAFGEAVANGYLAEAAPGLPFLFVTNFLVPGGLIDFTEPRAVAWWEQRIRRALDAGADGFMQDYGEQVLDGMRFANGETGATMHNRYPTLYHRITRAVVERYERETGREIWFFTRAGWTGSARYESANFPGDETTDWSRSSGLASLAPDMLNRAVGGAYGFGTDIGGYFDFHTPPTTRELFIRWAQWAVLSPVMRLHGSASAGTHTPWSYGEDTARLYRELSELRVRAQPLILRLWRQAKRTGIPITRPLWLAAPGDPEAAGQDQEWLLGRDVLVAPVVEEGARSREVYFPRGCWRAPDTGERFRGPATWRVEAPLERLPWFVRCGRDPLD